MNTHMSTKMNMNGTCQVDKLEFVQHVLQVSSEEGRNAELALYRRCSDEAESILLQASPPLIYRAIKLNVSKWRAVSLWCCCTVDTKRAALLCTPSTPGIAPISRNRCLVIASSKVSLSPASTETAAGVQCAVSGPTRRGELCAAKKSRLS